MARLNETMLVIDMPHYYAALIIQGGMCVEAAPILKWCIGKREPELIGYFKRKARSVFRVEYADGSVCSSCFQ